ncbi:alpha-amylase family glycosyl hydrolase [Mycoplasmopsis alligatoris]|uniref:Alpha-amylase n=1 Tax=Mycoplasmopsis alligatoris A21JP2 TaxID=747682 RepID=D4XWP4_9BACT|nr:alpha-amylase family glycosyl hydrolase [Mycoplasmopsis alligatoris]EFF41113.1 alpha amylase, catalytic domain protein [Mycoplasmopsis alligatoris A21JP2]
MKTIKLQDKVLYQIFPRSFKDSTGNGNGDIKGITSKLDYLKDLGINGIWLCPIYETNFVDAGYDVLDYKQVWKQFGTLEDFKELTTEARKRGIDIIMDIVLNHVSNEHNWFKKACESVDNVEHNYFIWRKTLSENEKKAQSIFGGSAWEYVKSIDKYYFHLFAKEQVDLNWQDPSTIKAMVEVINFWYDLGVRGFRLDAIKHVAKDFDDIENIYFSWCKGSVDFLKDFTKQAFSGKDDAYTLGEASGINLEELLKYGSGKDKVSDNYFNFSWWWIGWSKETGRKGYDANWDFKEFALQQKPFQETKEVKPEMITNFLSNHDTARSISRWGDVNYFWEESAKTHALMLFALKGIPCIYYGEEIGLLNNRFKERNDFRDCDVFSGYIDLVDTEKKYTEEEFTKYNNINSRDAGRAIMQWNKSNNKGFNTTGKTWIKYNDSTFLNDNVQDQLNDKNSIFNFYKNIINLRKNDYAKVLIEGNSKIELQNDIIVITRTNEKSKLVALINMQNKEINFNLPEGKILISSYNQKPLNYKLRAFESVLIEIKEV